MNRKMIEKTVEKRVIHDGSFLSVRDDLATDVYGNLTHRLVVDHPGGVGVVALDEENHIFLVRQYRYAMEEVVLEIPAGKLEADEEPLSCGRRELVEETGYEAKEMESLGLLYPTPGYCSEKIYLFLARKLTFKGQHFDPSEYVECERMALQKAKQLVLDGEIVDAKTQIAILKVSALCGF